MVRDYPPVRSIDTGEGTFSVVTTVQRVNTKGGMALGPCSHKLFKLQSCKARQTVNKSIRRRSGSDSVSELAGLGEGC